MTEIERLEGVVAVCSKCGLSETASQRVFGSGNVHAQVMFIGEAPGREENAQGLPFVGDAGQLLDRALEKLNVPRGLCYASNILKCWTSGKRKPDKFEVSACVGYLEEQIRLVDPVSIVAMGAGAAQTLLQIHSSIGKIRGKVMAGPHEKLVVPTWHPAYILRCGSMRGGSKSRQKKAAKEFIADLKLALDLAEVKWEEAG